MIGPVRRSSRVEIPAKQKKQSSKRKTISLSDSDYDVEEDVPNITPSPQKKSAKRLKTTAAASGKDVEEDAPSIVSTKRRVAGGFIPPNVPDVPMDNVSFHFIDSAAKWKFVYARRLGLERELSDETLEYKEVIDLIEKAGLMKTVSGLGACYEKLVKEFVVSIAEDCDNKPSKEYQQVFVRGKCVEFSPAIINRYLGRKEDGYSKLKIHNNEVCKVITANQVKVWPMKGKVPSCMLSVKYAVLNRIGTINWVPTTHSSTIATGLARLIYSVGTGTEVDYGTYIFDQTLQHGKSWAIRMPIAFPTLICGIILAQHPTILTADDEPCKRDSPISLHFELFEGDHAADIAGPSRKVPLPKKASTSTMNRRAMITSMEATVRALDKQKKELEKVISALKQEEAGEEGICAENAEVDAGDAGADDVVVDDAAGDAAVDDEAGGDTEELEVTESSTSF
ncbi:hypothetical protein QL285_075199 [Trifolium repens]|nr:hypothetical protein QL285_075199 [Trifolium repens]